jgi:hypothetical protein
MTWGNPLAVSFEKRHIRMVVVDHHRVKVHRSLAPVVERILLDLAKQGLAAETTGWEPGDDGRRVRIEVEGLTPDRAEAAMAVYGFSGTAEPFWFEWTGAQPPEGQEATQDRQGDDTAPIGTIPTKPTVQSCRADRTAGAPPRHGGGDPVHGRSGEHGEGLPGVDRAAPFGGRGLSDMGDAGGSTATTLE